MEKRGLVWFRNDLRLRDNTTLARAIAYSDSLIPVYCIDTRLFKDTAYGFKKTDHLRTNFLLESLLDLKKSLNNLNSDLIILTGITEDKLSDFCKENNVTRVFASKEVTWEETETERKLEYHLNDAGIEIEFEWQSTLFHDQDIPWPIRKLPDVFTKFRKENEKFTDIRKEINSPESLPALPYKYDRSVPTLSELGFTNVPNIDDRAAIKFEGGENAAWKRLNHYFWEGDHLKTYKYTRNGLLGEDYSSKFSAWLSLGCISPKSIYHEVKKYEKEVKKNSSTYWLVFELIWRDYFRFVCKKYGNRVFFKKGIRNEEIETKNYVRAFEKWKNGEMGIPFIDANMIELKTTGFMSNRGRQNVASFLVKDLQIDWRWGAAWFESQLIDYDVCSNWGNWMYVAGVGNDPRDNRYFNIMSQAQKYDSKGEYVRHWIPQLRDIPGFKAHHPSELSREELADAGIELGVDYPNPLVNPEKWMVF